MCAGARKAATIGTPANCSHAVFLGCLLSLIVPFGEIYFYDPTGGQCSTVTDASNTCPAQTSDQWTVLVATGGDAATVGNLGCGEYNDVTT